MKKLIALSLGLAGWLTYGILWLGVRIHDTLILDFGVWWTALEQFELWIEPIIIVGIILFIVWVMLKHMIELKDTKK